MRRVIIISILLLSGCLFQEDTPEIAITIENPPQELIISDVFDFSVSLTNEGDASAFHVKLESNIPALLTFENEEIAEIEEGFTKKVNITIEAVDILKEERESDTIEAVIKVKYFDSEDNQKTAKSSFEFVLRKPEIRIEKVDAGLLPGKISATENEEVPISVYVQNKENRKMENLYIVFCSEYENVRVHRIDIEEVGNCFEYRIQDVLWFNDLLAKGFTMEASLPTGAREVSFTVLIKLVWRTDGYEVVLDVRELKVEVVAA
jgi:hypothetical protein